MRTGQDIDRIVKDVQARLTAKRQATGIDLQVPDAGYVDEGDWLSIIVTPASGTVRAYDYVETLSEVEADLRRAGERNVILLPAMA